MLRTTCAGCGSGSLTKFLDLGSSPLADRFPASADEEETWYPLRVAVCGSCWLVQLLDVVPDAELYGADYGFHTGASPASLSYFRDLAAELLARYQLARKLVVEIACNDGTFLDHFRLAGCRCIGIEPAGPPAHEARVKGLAMIQEPFTSDLPASEGIAGKATLVLAFNVAAHVADPLDFLTGIRRLLRPGGVAVVEFQSLADLLAGCQVDHAYHEHRFFYSLSSFTDLAAKAGLGALSVTRTPAQGGSLRVTLGHLSSRPAGVAWSHEGHLRRPEIYAGLQDRADYARLRLVETLAEEKEAGRVVAGYGATAKSATLLNWCKADADLIPWIEDLTPGKIGRYSPGSKIPIVLPGDRPRIPDAYLLMAWNYLGSVLGRERKFMDSGGRFIVPGPVPVTI